MNTKFSHRLVGHRGLMVSHPENTLVGYQASIAAGARFIECDLQLTKDKQVVVLHDDNLKRTANVDTSIFDIDLTEAMNTSVHQPDKFGDKYKNEFIAPLGAFVELVAKHPQVKAMIEIKQESIDRFGLGTFIDEVFPLARQLPEQLIVISFNADAVVEAKKAGLQSGWVVRKMNKRSEKRASKVKPDYLITDVLKVNVNDPQLWQAPADHQWQWMLYDVMEADVAKSLMDKGVDLIETGDISGLIKHFDSILTINRLTL